MLAEKETVTVIGAPVSKTPLAAGDVIDGTGAGGGGSNGGGAAGGWTVTMTGALDAEAPSLVTAIAWSECRRGLAPDQMAVKGGEVASPIFVVPSKKEIVTIINNQMHCYNFLFRISMLYIDFLFLSQ